jgi:tRNA dimethylallyltransferase
LTIIQNDSAPPPHRILAVVGATATGKSDLAIELALRVGGEVVNVDSMQLYRGMDIGTAKLTMAERRGVPHHLLDIWDVSRTASVAEYQRLADEVIDGILARGRVPILAGGSGLYVRAVLGDLDFPGTDEAVRARLEAELEAVGPGPLHERLTVADPVAAAAILSSNGRRIVRALEVIEISGRPFSATMPGYDSASQGGFAAPSTPQRGVTPLSPPFPGEPAQPAGRSIPRAILQVGIRLSRPELDRRIELRVDRMFAAGLEAEVRDLADNHGLRGGKTASRALGYQQVLRYLDEDWTLEAARDETVRATRRFARRQESWFRRDSRVTWLDAGDIAGQALEMWRSVTDS